MRRQLWGLAIAAKRYALFEKVFDHRGKLVDIKIVNPKAHGIGFLYPPKDNPKNWKKDAPLWVYEMWDSIVRGFMEETSSMWAQGDDLSVVTDNDEAGFRVVEYGKSRRIVLPESLKREIQEA